VNDPESDEAAGETPRDRTGFPRTSGPGQPRPRCGPYYWFPRPSAAGLAWDILTCHDAGHEPDGSHVELWPFILEQLAAAWGMDAKTLKRRLSLDYTGLPRGRATRPERFFFVLHGNDAPMVEWQSRVFERFHLTGRRVKLLYDEHETQIPGHPEAFNATLGIGIGLGSDSRPNPAD